MVEKTNNKKVIDKDYLAEQFYNYNKKFIINDVKANKQDNLKIVSSHITFTSPNLGLKIINDEDAKENDYLVLNSEEGDLKWKTPISEQSELKDNDNFVLGKTVYNYKGSENIEIVGEIKTGTWNVGKIKINNDSLEIGTFKLKDNEELEISNEENKGIKTYSVSTHIINVTSEGDNEDSGVINTEKLNATNATFISNTTDNLKVNNIEAATSEKVNVKSDIIFEKTLKALLFKTNNDKIIAINNRQFTVTKNSGDDVSADFITW